MTARALYERCWVVRAPEGHVWDVDPDVHYASAGEAAAEIEAVVTEQTDAVFQLQVAQICGSAPVGDVRLWDALIDDARAWLGTARLLTGVPMPGVCQVIECDNCRATLQDEDGGDIHWDPCQSLAPRLWGWTTDTGQDHCPDCADLTCRDELTAATPGQLALPLGCLPSHDTSTVVTPPADTDDDGWGS